MKAILIIFFVFVGISCHDIRPTAEPQVIADFSMEIYETDYYKVHFVNNSENATAFSWDFGNGDSSNLENPTYTYLNEGTYDVRLTAYGINHSEASKTRNITLFGIPDQPLWQLCGKDSKTWKLYRVGAAASLGPDSSQADLWWQGLYNDGSASCLYKHEFTFNIDNSFEFEHHNVFWGDHMIWLPDDSVYRTCFEPTSENMTVNNTDLSVWLSGVHHYEFNCSSGTVILRGRGAWIGFPFLGTASNHGTNLPDSVAFTVSFEQNASFDLMTVNFDHGEDGFWTFRYVNYDDWQDEPPLIE